MKLSPGISYNSRLKTPIGRRYSALCMTDVSAKWQETDNYGNPDFPCVLVAGESLGFGMKEEGNNSFTVQHSLCAVSVLHDVCL